MEDSVTDRETDPSDGTGQDPSGRDRSDSLPDPAPDAALSAKVRHRWRTALDPGQRSALIAWGAFVATFGATRGITHWIRDGHGPSGGGMSVGGNHFHHYNLGILGLTAVGAIAVRGEERHRRHPAVAAGYGAAGALIVDEAALLLDLKDVYWAKQGRTSVDLAIGVIALGGLGVTGSTFWRGLARDLRRH